MRSSWPVRFLLPAVQVLAEGGWLTVVYAALAALAGVAPRIGPIELALLAWVGLAWGRRSRWTNAAAEAIGLPVLMLLGGAVGWLLAPEVRALLVEGHPLEALGTHLPGWIGAIAVWRGDGHRVSEDDDVLAGELLRWIVPGLAIPWLIGHQMTSGEAEVAFTSAAFMGTIVFVASAFTAMGLARLEAVRAATGGDLRINSSWLVLVLGVAIGVTVVGIPAAALLGVPASALLVVLVGPLRLVLLFMVLLSTPLILAIAWLTELIGPLLPLPTSPINLNLNFLKIDPVQVVSDVPTIVFFLTFTLLALLGIAFVALVIYIRWQERRRYRFDANDPFEERSIVVPPPEPVEPSQLPRRSARRGDLADPTRAYLAALDELARDGRWARHPAETPAAHLDRARQDGLPGSALARLAAAYQLARYGERRLARRESARARGRLAQLRTILRRQT